MNNVIKFEDIKRQGDTRKKIKSLQKSIKAYTEIVTVKKSYLNALHKFEKYDRIKDECRKVYIQIVDYESQIRFMERQLDNLSQGKA